MEAMPLAWLEVLAMGKCFIGGRIGPGYEAVKENETGLLANPHDSKDIAEKILQVMNNVSFAQDLGMNARKDIIKRFSIDKLIKDNIDFYNRIIQKKQMTFSIITHVLHKKTVTNEIGGYAPYIREMNIWLKQVNKVIVVAPCEKKEFTAIDIAYQHANISFLRVPLLDFTSLAKTLKSSIWVPYIMICIGVAMFRSDHIHLRCPGNMGLLGCICQIFFPWKKKTAKYAGNWDWNSVQPQSYRFQQKLLSNTTFTKNIQVLVYGEWKNSTKNILPFFTASYSEQEKINILPKKLSGSIELLFVGTLSTGKRPLLSVDVVKYLHNKGYDVHLTLLGEGSERKQIEDYIHQFSLDNIVEIKGNVSSEEVKREMQQTHFLLFAPQSEGWPKAVAESMFWGCVPITTRVSCIEQMLGNGSRGALIEPTVESIHQTITDYMGNPETYKLHSLNAQNWSQLYTLERFEKEIKKLM
jgi:glycosyltransferase involved in cell wall biosynthesis